MGEFFSRATVRTMRHYAALRQEGLLNETAKYSLCPFHTRSWHGQVPRGISCSSCVYCGLSLISLTTLTSSFRNTKTARDLGRQRGEQGEQGGRGLPKKKRSSFLPLGALDANELSSPQAHPRTQESQNMYLFILHHSNRRPSLCLSFFCALGANELNSPQGHPRTQESYNSCSFCTIPIGALPSE